MAKIEIIQCNKKIQVNASAHTDNAFNLNSVNLTIADGKTLVLVGPSGCGKSTLLRLIAGLMQPDSGKIRFDGRDVSELSAKEREIGMVFQNYALYPTLTVKQNIISYFLLREKLNDLSEQSQQAFLRTSRLLNIDIKHLLNRMPPHLSGGEKQKVALARCITRNPRLFLMDEPFCHLDQNVRSEYRQLLKQLLAQFSITTVLVTHDQQEAMLLGNEVAVMQAGKIIQVDTYQQLYSQPINEFVASFINPNTLTPAINWLPEQLFNHNNITAAVRCEHIQIINSEQRHVNASSYSASIVQMQSVALLNYVIVHLQLKEVQLEGEELKRQPLEARELVAEISQQQAQSLSLQQEVLLVFQELLLFDKITKQRVQ